MFTFNERDLHRMPPPLRTHLPVKGFIAASNILDEEDSRDNEADIALLRLPAPSLRGTFAKAYSLLTKLTAQIGWDELLRTRSVVFVMEEEYRKHKAHASIDGSPDAMKLDDDASTKAVRSPRPTVPIDTENLGGGDSTEGQDDKQLDVPQTPIPTIKISSESDHERELAALKKVGVSANGDSIPSPVQEEEEEGEGEEKDVVPKPMDADEQAASAITKPEQVQPASEDRAPPSAEDAAAEMMNEDDADSSFHNKRLCERWLDNLFMSLYEVRVLRHSHRCLAYSLSFVLTLFDRTCECTQFGEQRLRISKPSTCLTARQAPRFVPYLHHDLATYPHLRINSSHCHRYLMF